MPILRYTTEVDAGKTVNEIERILEKHHATSILKNYDDQGIIEALSFQIKTAGGMLPIKLPVRPAAVQEVMRRQNVPLRYQNKTQAVRVAWRIVKEWVAAQMALCETDQVKLEEVFLPYVQIGQRTMFQVFQERQQLLLKEGEEQG